MSRLSGSISRGVNRGILSVISLSVISSCTWREIGCSTGATAAYLFTSSRISAIDKNREEKGRSKLSDAEKASLYAVAMSLGCVIGSEIAGGLEEYTIKKREEYKTEAEYLKAHISGLEDAISKVDSELEWINGQLVKLQEDANRIKDLPDQKQEMAAKLKEAAAKRKQDADNVENYLKSAKADAQHALKTTSDEELKKQLKEDIKKVDVRLAQVKQVSKDLVKVSSKISY